MAGTAMDAEASAGWDPRGLLLSRRLEHVRFDPFCFFYVDDYLPAEVYRELGESFPADPSFRGELSGKMGFRSSVESDSFDGFAAAHPAWKWLLDFFASDAFLDDTRRTLQRALVDAHGQAGRKRWYNCNRRGVPAVRWRYALQEPVRTTFQFSLLPPGARVTPHTDAPRKLVSLLLYFREPDWQDDWGGGTEYYAPLDPERSRAWSRTERVPFAEFKEIGATPFAANRLAGFVRSDASYHGVAPVACPSGRARRSLLVNIKRIKWAKRDVP